MLGRHEDGVRADPVLIDQSPGLYVIEMDIAVLGDRVDDAVLLRNLHSDGEVVLRLGWEEHVNGFFLEWRVPGGRGPHLYDVKFPSSCSSHSKTEQGRLLLISLHLELTEGGRVALDGLGDVPLHAVELHRPDHPVVLGADPDEEEPGVVLVSAVVDYLAARQTGVTVEYLGWSAVSLHTPVKH